MADQMNAEDKMQAIWAAGMAEHQARDEGQPRKPMSSHGTDLEAQGRRDYYRSLNEPPVTPPTPRGFCTQCGGPTSVSGRLCDECSGDE